MVKYKRVQIVRNYIIGMVVRKSHSISGYHGFQSYLDGKETLRIYITDVFG